MPRPIQKKSLAALQKVLYKLYFVETRFLYFCIHVEMVEQTELNWA